MLIAGAMDRAAQRLRETATPLSDYIRSAFGDLGVPPLDAGAGSPYAEVVKRTQRPGWRGFLDLFIFDGIRSGKRRNKFSKQAAANYTGPYPRHLCSPRGLEFFYGDKSTK
ncbi:MAG: hypothetical protein ABIJ09_02240 [Pseudomonadota bacterium]